MTIQEATKKQLENWDSFTDRSINGTLFHKRGFLAYHSGRFAGRERFLTITKGTTVFAQISLSLCMEDDGILSVCSPFGASYGGFVLSQTPSYEESREMIELFLGYLGKVGVKRCSITFPPEFTDRMQLDTFYFAMMEQGFYSVQRDVENMVRLQGKNVEETVTASVRSQIKAAKKSGIVINRTPDLRQAYRVLYKEKVEKFDARPTHSLEEFLYLHRKFPGQVYTVTGEDKAGGGEILAGMTCFRLNCDINLSFYFFIAQEHKKRNALRPVILNGLIRDQENGVQSFSFGTSSVEGKAHPATFQFKEGFGRLGRFRETFVWEEKE